MQCRNLIVISLTDVVVGAAIPKGSAVAIQPDAWQGMIEPDQDPQDMLHVTDLFTTAARIAGAMNKIPNDRVTDGIDQTALLLFDEGHGRFPFGRACRPAFLW